MKVLITADIHIDDYPNYNYEYRSRLNQFNKLSERLIKIGREYNCQELWILGDLVEKPNSRPYIMHVAKNFIRTVCAGFMEVRYILGNHDIDSKSQSLDFSDSHLTLFDQPELTYMDRKVITIGNHTFGFMNWRPEQDLTWLDELGYDHIDILLGHYTKSTLFGQEIDESKFDLMIHGDIHNSQVIGKFVSVCNPIQKDMSSEAVGKVIVLDTDTLEWTRVETDPNHDTFLRLSYVQDRALEGFMGPYQYNIYKPVVEISSDDQVKTMTWSDIDELISETCKSENVEDIHNEVESSCVPYSEIDFNFQLKKFKIHGYRSIVDLEIDFDRDDRIVLLGDNGSGKSSIIRSLKGAFEKNSYLKYEKSDLCDGQLLEVSLIYQNKLYEITKGDICRLVIDGSEQGYSSKTEFESDLKVKLPFLNYLDLLFITSDVMNLSNQFTPSRRIDLISKFYRLDRIEAYYKTAMNLYNETNQQLVQLQSTRDAESSVVTLLNTRLAELVDYKDKTEEEFKSKLTEYQVLRSKHTEFELWTKTRSELLSKVDVQSRKVNTLSSKVDIDIDRCNEDKKSFTKRLSDLDKAYSILYKESVDFESNLKRLTEIRLKGEKLASQVKSLENDICPLCKTLLKDSESKTLYESMSKDLDEARTEYVDLESQLLKAPRGLESIPYYKDALNQISTEYKNVKDALEILSNKIQSYTINYNELQVEIKVLESFKTQLDTHESNKPEFVELPQNLQDLENKVISDLSKVSEYKSLNQQLEDHSKTINELTDQITPIVGKIDKINKYLELTANSGVIYESILKVLAERFSTSEVRYELESGVYRGSRYLNFNTLYLTRGSYRLYESLSDGQKTVCDMDFLDKLFSVQVGLLAMDEHLSHLDDKNASRAYEILKNMNVNVVLMATHDNNVAQYTRRLLLRLNDRGETICQKD